MGWQKREITSDELQDPTFNQARQEVGCTGRTEDCRRIGGKVRRSKNLSQLRFDALKKL